MKIGNNNRFNESLLAFSNIKLNNKEGNKELT